MAIPLFIPFTGLLKQCAKLIYWVSFLVSLLYDNETVCINLHGKFVLLSIKIPIVYCHWHKNYEILIIE